MMASRAGSDLKTRQIFAEFAGGLRKALVQQTGVETPKSAARSKRERRKTSPSRPKRTTTAAKGARQC